MAQLEELAAKLRGVKLKTNSYLCHCPAHADEKPSMTLAMGDDHKVVWHCKAGCSQDSVFQAIKPFLHVEKEVPILKKRWVYQTAKGQDHLRVSRYETVDGKKTFLQEHLDGTSWVKGGAREQIAPLYFQEWKDEPFVFLVEGEKCCDALREKIEPATAIPGGASGWKDSYAPFFKAKKVQILPDNDGPGIAFAQTVARSIKEHGGFPSIKKLQGLGEKEDVVEWLSRGGDPKSLYPEEKKTVFQEIDEIISFNAAKSISFGIPLFDDALGKITPTDLVLLTGTSGHGKTALATHLSNRVCLNGGKVTFFSLESFYREVESRLIFTMMADKFYSERIKSFTRVDYRSWIQGNPETVKALAKYRKECEQEFQTRYADRLNVIYRDSSQFSIKDFERQFALHAPTSDLIIVDHLNYFDSHSEKINENKMMEECMKRIRDCVLIAKKPVLLLTHVRKKDGREKKILPELEDIQGSSNIFKIATKAIIIGIDYTSQEKDISRTLVRIPKDRYGEGIARYLFRMNFNLKTRDYSGKYEIGRVGREAGAEIFEPLEGSKIPSWVTTQTEEGEL